MSSAGKSFVLQSVVKPVKEEQLPGEKMFFNFEEKMQIPMILPQLVVLSVSKFS